MRGSEAWPAGRRLLIRLLLLSFAVVNASKVLDEVPWDLESHQSHHSEKRQSEMLSDDEDLTMSAEGSADLEEGSTPDVFNYTTVYIPNGKKTVIPVVAELNSSPEPPEYVYYRVLVNFTNSIKYTPELENFESAYFREISEGIIDALESAFRRISGDQSVTVVLIREVGESVIVELDVGSDDNSNDVEIKNKVLSAVKSGSIGPYETSLEGFSFRHLGEETISSRPCQSNEFPCGSGECVPLEYRCDQRADCSDMSDEDDCADTDDAIPTAEIVQPIGPEVSMTTRVITRPVRPVQIPTVAAPLTPATGVFMRPCSIDKAVCQNGQCIPRDYLCDGERDCSDGSDELDCGTPSPCEPNEFKCKNGRCAVKLWRCDGDNDCGDNSDEEYCPTKGPGDMCSPEQFVCVTDRLCIPASYQCDEEADCPDRSDEFGCTPPQVITPPEETVMVKRGATVTLTCVAAGVPTPIITWRLNWGHIPVSSRVTMTSQNGQGTLIIRDVKESDQGAYTCEAINARGMIFAIPDALLVLRSNTGFCSEGHFNVEGTLQCIPCFCFGLTRNCVPTSRYRDQIHLRFTEEDNFMGVNVTMPTQPATLPLSSSQMVVDPEYGEFQLVDLSRRFLNQETFWTLPRQFLGNKIDSYGGYLRYKIRYSVPRGQVQPEGKPDVIITGNGKKLIYKDKKPTQPNIINQKEILFTEDHWQHESGTAVTREDLMMALANLDSILIRTKYDNRMASVGLSDIVMDTTSAEFTTLGRPRLVEECRCPQSYTGLSCESCASGFNRVPTGSYLGVCDGCSCNGHASTCDKVTGYCLNCQHNTEGPRCDKCKPGYFGDPTHGTPSDCMPCPCPFIESSSRFSDSCFLDVDGRPTCDSCQAGYTGRRCETCAVRYTGNPTIPGGKCTPIGEIAECDSKGTDSTNLSAGYCVCKPNVVGRFCNECKKGSFHLDESNADGCLKCFCMGNSKDCASSSWHRDQVRGGFDAQDQNLYALSNLADTRRMSEGIRLSASNELTFTAFTTIPRDMYYLVLPEQFKGDKVTSYGGKLQYTILHRISPGASLVTGLPDVILRGSNVFLEHYSRRPEQGVPTTITVPFKETEWRRADGQPATRENLLIALADIKLLMIRASYSEGTTETRISKILMDVAVPHSTGQEQAVEVEECVCPEGYRGSSCQECDFGYIRKTNGLYLGTCERCDCNSHSDCDAKTGRCLACKHNTQGQRCEQCLPGFYGDATLGKPDDCQPCPCPGTTTSDQFSSTCLLDSDGKPTCNNCPSGFGGRNCERNLTEFCKVWMQPVILESKKMIPDDCQKITGGGSRVTGNTTEPAGRQGNGKPDVSSTVRNTTGNVTNAGNSSDVSNTKSKKAIQRTALSQRASSFRQLMKASVIGFNRRLAMLENTGLDLKDSFKHLQKRQDDLSHQLRNLTQMLAAPSKDKLISDLTWKYTEVDDKLTALQVRLEILIDGFAALAEEVSDLKKRKALRTNSDQPDSSKIATSSPQHQKALSKTSSKLKPASHGGYNKSLSFVSTKPSVKVPSVGATERRKGKQFRFHKKQTNDVDLMPSVEAEVTTTASPVQSTSKTQASRKLGAKNKPLPGKGRAVGKEVPRTENPALTLDLVSSTLHANVTGFTIAPSTLSIQLTPTAVLKQTEKTYPRAAKGKAKAGDLGTVNHPEGPARGKGVTKPSSKTRTELTGKTKPSRRLPGQSQGKVKPGRKITAHPKDETKRGNTAATQHRRTSASTSNNDASEKYKIKDPSTGASMHRKRKEFLRSDVSTLSPVIKQPKLASQRPLPMATAAKKISAEGRAQPKDATEIPLRRSESQPVAGPQEKICVNENPIRNKTTGTRKRKAKKASALDILQLLKGGYRRYTGRKVKNLPLYITLGRLAIPIKIIPD